MTTPGFNIPIHNSLTTPILLGGAPRKFSIINGTILAAVTLGLQSFYAIPICLLAQGVAVYYTKKDPYFFEVMLRHIKQKVYYRV